MRAKKYQLYNIFPQFYLLAELCVVTIVTLLWITSLAIPGGCTDCIYDVQHNVSFTNFFHRFVCDKAVTIDCDNVVITTTHCSVFHIANICKC